MQVQSGILVELKEESKFVGYNTLEANARVLVIIKDGELVDQAESGEEVQIILDETPFMLKAEVKLLTKESSKMMMWS